MSTTQPTWVTPAGSLGTVPEGTFYQVPLVAYEPEVVSQITNIVTTGSFVTFSFANQLGIPYKIGSSIIVAGFTLSTGFNGTHTITRGTTNSVTFSSSATSTKLQVASSTSTGTNVTLNFSVTLSTPLTVGSTIIVQGFLPTSYNGAFIVTASTTSSVTFASSLTSLVTFYGTVTDSGTITNEPTPLLFQVIAGSLPTGVVCDPVTGTLTGIPATTYTPEQDVIVNGADITSQFAIRAYTTKKVNNVTVRNRFVDRTFTITVSGIDTPEWITPPGEIGVYFDGTLLLPGKQLDYNNNPTPGIPEISLVAGQLPPGLTLSSTGLISGFIQPNPLITVPAGFSRDGQSYDEYPFDFNTQSENYNYEFVLKVTNGETSALRTFTMFVWSTSTFTADVETLTYNNEDPPVVISTAPMSADNDCSQTIPPAAPAYVPPPYVITASISSLNVPVLMNPQGSIGSVRNDNFFAYQFTGQVVGDNVLGYVGQDLPPGLELNAETGWLYGYIPNLGLTELTYDFTVRVYDYYNPGIISPLYSYSLTTVGPISTNITWLVPSELGFIVNGATSTFYVRATNTADLALQYRLQSGSDSKLPQGLTLLPSGNIVGRVSFDNFSLDNNATIFDAELTTFDLTYTFTVNAYSVNGLISVFKTFTIHVEQLYGDPYNNLYIECMPPVNDRELISSLVRDPSIFPPALVYRNDDPNFGVAKNVIYNHAYGLTAATLDDYVVSLELNHYWKNLVLGEIKTAQALDDLGNVLYEVVYSEVVDDLVNNDGQPVGKEVVLAYPVNPDTIDQIDIVYPNALEDMRVQVIDTVGQVSKILPRWMQSKQTDGRVLGFTPAWVIAYTNPGASGQIAYNIQQQFGTQLNVVDFKADRYELDRSMTVNWDPQTVTVNINNISGNGTIITIEYAEFPVVELVSGDAVTISNVNPTEYNGTYYVLSVAPDANQITVLGTASSTWIAGGKITTAPHWIPNPPTLTTFDITEHNQLPEYNLTINFYGNDVFDQATSSFTPGSFDSSILPGTGSGYAVGDQIKILGTEFVNPTTGINGTSTENDLIIQVTQVQDNPDTSVNGEIVAATVILNKDIAPPLSAGKTWNITNTISLPPGTGTGAEFEITSVPGDQTIFDGNSIQFTAPADMNTNTNAYDRYLLFPKKNIITPLPTYDGEPVNWTNDSSAALLWVNDLEKVVGWVNTTA